MALIGILGGMGPLATVDFMEQIIRLTTASGATCDQQHLPLLVANLPHIPDRSHAMMGTGEDALPALLAGIDLLNHNHVDLIVIPCNSAHYWYATLRARSRVPILHIVDVCVAAVPRNPASTTLPARKTRAAVLATGGTLRSGLYQQALVAQDVDPVEPDALTQSHIAACIDSVKAGNLAEAAAELSIALHAFAACGAEAAVMGCTEIPLAARYLSVPVMPLIDSTVELARATVAYSLARGWSRP